MATWVNGSAGEMGRGGCLVEKLMFGSLNPPRSVSNTFRRMRNVGRGGLLSTELSHRRSRGLDPRSRLAICGYITCSSDVLKQH